MHRYVVSTLVLARACPVWAGVVALLLLAGCGFEQHKVGQVEVMKFRAEEANQAEESHPWELLPLWDEHWGADYGPRLSELLRPRFGDLIRHDEDTITLQVHSLYIDALPRTLTGSGDIVLFVDVWEDAAYRFNQKASLTRVVYSTENQTVPGLVNFTGGIAYGPAQFKGHPMCVHFTLMLLQRRKAQETAQALAFFQKALEFIPTYGTIASTAVGGFRELLKSQPDITFFDYELTLLSDNPEKLLPTTSSADDASDSPGYILNSYEPKKGLEARMPWMQYGMYALVETQPYHGAFPFINREPLPDTGHKPVYEFREGRILRKGQDAPDFKYLTFSLTPGQIALHDGFLHAVADKNRAMLADLQQSSADVQESLKNVEKSMTEIARGVITMRMEAIMREVRKKTGDDKDAYTAEYKHRTEALKATLDNPHESLLDSGQLRKIAEDVQAAVENKWSDVLTGAPGEPTSMPAVYRRSVQQFCDQAKAAYEAGQKEADTPDKAHQQALDALKNAFGKDYSGLKTYLDSSPTARPAKPKVDSDSRRKALSDALGHWRKAADAADAAGKCCDKVEDRAAKAKVAFDALTKCREEDLGRMKTAVAKLTSKEEAEKETNSKSEAPKTDLTSKEETGKETKPKSEATKADLTSKRETENKKETALKREARKWTTYYNFSERMLRDATKDHDALVNLLKHSNELRDNMKEADANAEKWWKAVQELLSTPEKPRKNLEL